MSLMTIETKKRFMINTAFIVLIAIAVYFALKYLTIWLLPFIIGFICAMSLQRPVNYLSQKTRLPRAIWSLILVALVLTILFGAIALIGYHLYDQLSNLVTRLSDLIPGLQEELGSIGARFSGWLDRLPDGLAQELRSAPEQLANNSVSFLTESLTDVAALIIVNIPSLLLTTVVSVVACCFITMDYYKITNFILNQFSLKTQKVLLKAKRVFSENILKMLRGYLIVMGITFLELFFGLLILGIPYTGVLALIIAVVDIFPVLGTGTVLIPWGVICLCTGKPGTGIGLLVLYIIITIIRNIIEPKIIGQQVGLPAVVTLISMYLGLNLFGFAGLWGLPILLIVLVKLQDSGMIHIWKDGSRISQSVAEERQLEQEGTDATS